jgi:hypothetical protein
MTNFAQVSVASSRQRRFRVVLVGLLFLFVATSATAQVRTVLVSPIPGDPVGSGTALRNALNGISSPSSTNRWLLKIEPGVYDIGAAALAMRSWVDIEGSGMGVTTIRGTVVGFQDAGTINGASNAELRLLTVEAIGSPAADAIAMYNGSAFPRLYRVKLVAQSSFGVAWGMRNVESAPRIEECEITATASGAGSSAYGIVFRRYVSGAETASILRSKIAVFGATNNYGIYIVDGQMTTELRDSRIDVTGGAASYGVYATRQILWEGVSVLTTRNVEVISSGGSSTSSGVHLSTDTVVTLDIVGSKIWGSGSPTTYGIYQGGNAPVGVGHSSVTGFTQTVQSVISSVSISSTHLQGGPATAGGWLGCMGVWDENAVFYGNSCP